MVESSSTNVGIGAAGFYGAFVGEFKGRIWPRSIFSVRSGIDKFENQFICPSVHSHR